MTSVVSYTSVLAVLRTVPAINSMTNIASADVAHHAARVEALMNAKLSRSYALPFTSALPLLEAVATDLTIYDIIAKRNITMTRNEDNDWPSRFKSAEKLLDQIASGELPLITSSGSAITPSAGAARVWSSTQAYTPTFNEDASSVTMTQDQDKLDAIEDSRD